MRNQVTLVFMAVVALAMSGCVRHPSEAEKVVAQVYAPYLSHAAEQGGPSFDALPVYSKSFKADIDRGLDYGNLLNEPVIDFDPIASGQEFSISKLKLNSTEAGAKAHVVASFDNLGTATRVDYDLIQEDGAWKIDAIKSSGEDLGKVIADALKPVGAPDSMKAPIAALYAMYAGPAAAIEPLQRSGLLTSDFRDYLTKASTKPTGASVLGFDPVRGGPGDAISDVRLEAASAAVIARFKVGGQDRIVVYDLVEEQGSWRIDDVRGPRADPPWDLRVKLEDTDTR